MKNILITVISVLMTVLIIITMIKGLTIGKIKILSIADIKQNSMDLDKKIEELNTLKNLTYKQKVGNLEDSTKRLTTAKQKYLEVASLSTDEQIKAANQEPVYSMEFLWDKVGSYATREGLKLKWVVPPTGTTNKSTLSFTLTGAYISIINYVYAIENDSELAFRIENFKMVPAGGEGESLTATFTVSNIGVKQESTTTRVTSTTTDTTKTTTNNTNTTHNTTNTTTQNKETKSATNSLDEQIDDAIN